MTAAGGPYLTEGKCDYCDALPGDLVNGLTPCACFMGIGAPVETCTCPWGKRERARRQKAAKKAGENAVAPTVSSRGSWRESGAAGAGQHTNTEALGAVREPTPGP